MKWTLQLSRQQNEVSEILHKVNRIGSRNSRTPVMWISYSCKPRKSGRGTFRNLGTLDGSCTTSLIPTSMANEWGLTVDISRGDINLKTADGGKMAVGVHFICLSDF